MRWTIRIVGIFALAWLAFLVSPFVALHNFGRAVERRDLEAIRERISFRALRVSLLKQVFNVAAQEKGARGIEAGERQYAVEVAAGLAEPIVGQLLTPEAIVDLLNDGWPDALLGPAEENGGAPTTVIGHLRVRSLHSAWRLFRTSEVRGFRNIIVSLPPDQAAERQFRIRLRLVNSTWKLVNIELPAALLHELARKLATHGRQGGATPRPARAGA